MSRTPGPGAEALLTAMRKHARVEGPLVKVDDFLNHRVDPVLMEAIGGEVAARWSATRPTVVLTAEASGIAPAMASARNLGVDMIYAKKYPRARGADRPSLVREVASPTKGDSYRIEVTSRMLDASDRVLIVDDFLSRGRTAAALAEIAEEAGSRLVGLAFVIEKAFETGRALLESSGWEVDALVRVLRLEPDLAMEAPARPEAATG